MSFEFSAFDFFRIEDCDSTMVLGVVFRVFIAFGKSAAATSFFSLAALNSFVVFVIEFFFFDFVLSAE